VLTPIKQPPHRNLLDWETVQQTNQQNPLRHRTSHRELQDLENHAHRLSAPSGHVRPNHLNRHRTTLLQTGLWI